MRPPDGFRLAILTPVYEDWQAVAQLLSQLDGVCAQAGLRPRVLIVNDGSLSRPPDTFVSWPVASIESIEVLELYRNLGHQRALCAGLVHLYQQADADAVLILDADGEDAPGDVPRLLDRFFEESGRKMVFASRARRTEGIVFKAFYQFYRGLHRIFVGHDIRVGNFSVIPARALAVLVRSGHLWNHYAAAAMKSGLGFATVPIARAKRLHDKSKMSFVGLTVHGLSALSVNTDTIAARMLVVMSFALVLGIAAVAALVFWGSATMGLAMILLTLTQIVIIALLFNLGVLTSRTLPEVLPIRDCPFYVEGVTRLWPAAKAKSAGR